MSGEKEIDDPDLQREMQNPFARLLLKYICHVGEVEGSTFISQGYRVTDLFTDEEWDKLEDYNELSRLLAEEL